MVSSIIHGEMDASTQIEFQEMVPGVREKLLINSQIEPEIVKSFQEGNLEYSENEPSDFEGFQMF